MKNPLSSEERPEIVTSRHDQQLEALRKELMPVGGSVTELYRVSRNRKRNVLETIPRLSEFILPGDRSWARTWYLHSFKPDSSVARDFGENVYSVFVKFMSKDKEKLEIGWKDVLKDGPPEVPASVNHPISESIEAWLTRGQFRGREWCSGTDSLLEWMRRAAWLTLWMRLTQERDAGPLWWVPPITPRFNPKTRTEEFTLSFPSWQPLNETKVAFENRVRSRFEEALADHFATVVSQLPEGAEATPDRTPVLHFQWLARFQVDRESMSSIAREPGFRSEAVTREAVGQGIHSAAQHLIGPDYAKWLNSAPKGGRPAKHIKTRKSSRA